MSICIIGGNERMERQYVNICKKHNCSDVYTAKDSIALTRLMYDIRMSWNMIFDGETQV